MALGPTLPPQAYTREVLTSAFNWLQTQPESVRKMATTPDALVGLYMRAKRFGASSLESDAPVSGQNFISDLKNLAEGLKQFEEPKVMVETPSANPIGPSGPSGSMGLNERSRAMILEVRDQLNLSSDGEVINMMLALAYKSLKNLLT